ncbi:squalene synthase 1-like [Punica granatum]|uniref:Squalene synthase n=1 Tax=Punica granatum TaxID=22663 RepID=A0A6P8CMH0_PUNGR|nr:squalene synthase 1-like [Punica granatum]
MDSLVDILKHPEEICPLIKLRMVVLGAEKRTLPQPHWAFCYTIMSKVARSFAITIVQLDETLRDAILIFYLVLRALDTVEDDMSLSSQVKIPILKDFHEYIYDHDWHFVCGSSDCRVLMDQFHLVRKSFLELDKSHQDVIKDITRRMGAGMAKFIDKEVETIDDLNEYAHYVAGLVGVGLSKIFHASSIEDLSPEYLSNTMGCLLQKANVIRDYLEDIEEIPRPRMFWPREIWSKYVNKLEDLKNEENSIEAVHCLNHMVTSSFVYVEDCLKYLSALKDPAVFRFCATPQVMAIGTLALCYNNINVFRSRVKLRRGLIAKIIERTRTMSDVYGAFFEFCSCMKSKVDKHDPNASKTESRLEAIQQICINSGMLNYRRFYIMRSEKGYDSALIAGLLAFLSIFAYLSANHLLEIFKERPVTSRLHTSSGMKGNTKMLLMIINIRAF